MATIDIGKIKFTWQGAYSNSTQYEADDVVSHSGSSWIYIGTQTAANYDATTVYSLNDIAKDSSTNVIYRYINATAAAGNALTVTTHWAINEPSATNTAYWNIMADGASPLTTQGDIMTHDGTSSTRLGIGTAGQVLTSDGSDLIYQAIDAVQGRKVLATNYDNLPDFNATNTYGASGSRNWLADYANNWIPESGIPNRPMGPSQFSWGHQRGGYRSFVYLNQNHEVVISGGTDGYYWHGQNNTNTHEDGIVMGIHPEFGGLLDGEYFVRIWHVYQNIYCLTNKGSLFAAGYNGYGQLGVGDTTDRYGLVKVPGFGPNTTHNSQTNRIAGFHVENGGDGYGNYHACFAITENGVLFCWGQNSNGRLGDGTTNNASRPIEITTITNAIMVQTSYLTTFVVDANRNLFVTGYNANGILAGTTLSSNQLGFVQSTGATNVYMFLQSTHSWYSGGWTYVGTSHYLNTTGELYGSGDAGNGILGDGTTTDKNAWTRIGGSTTYSSIYYTGNCNYNAVWALGGTPFASDGKVYCWGYNGNGQLADGTTTNATSPKRPSTTMIYSYTTSSTAADSAPTQTLTTFPRDDISEIYALGGINGQATGAIICVGASDGTVYQSGYSQSHEFWQNNSGNAAINNMRIVVGPFSSPETTTGKHWAGEAQRTLYGITGHGHCYSSEGLWHAWFSDGTVMLIGYNGTGSIDSNQGFYGHWKQVN